MKKSVKHRIFISFICIVVLIPLVANARYFEKIENISGKGIIAEPIFIVNKMQDTITGTINKESNEISYMFSVKNYVIENDLVTTRISQVDMNYNIEIINENSNFPIKFELYESGFKENLLDANGKTADILISKDLLYEKQYQLVVTWQSQEGELADIDNIKIIVNSSQVK